jgi:nucleoside-diphosphate-sugar epimerase
MHILVTGATGFIGRSLVLRLAESPNIKLRASVRTRADRLPSSVHAVSVPDLSSDGDWSAAVDGIDVVVHLAARVHVMHDSSSEPLAAFRRTNVEGTLALARAAADSGVHRFVFLSSIKVNGDSTRPGRPFTIHDRPNPRDPYGVSKFEAEQGLVKIASSSSMQCVVIRPPLVYGPGVGANFRSMMQWIHRGIPLPLGSIHNERSLVSLANLIDLIVMCLDHPAAANQIFLVSDGEDLSSTELLRRVGFALNRRARLVPIPATVLKLVAAIVGRRDFALRLCESLQIDISETQKRLGWQPLARVNVQLQETADEFMRTQKS